MCCYLFTTNWLMCLLLIMTLWDVMQSNVSWLFIIMGLLFRNIGLLLVMMVLSILPFLFFLLMRKLNIWIWLLRIEVVVRFIWFLLFFMLMLLIMLFLWVLLLLLMFMIIILNYDFLLRSDGMLWLNIMRVFLHLIV